MAEHDGYNRVAEFCTVDLYRDLIRGKVTGREVWTALQAVNRVGVTRGTLESL